MKKLKVWGGMFWYGGETRRYIVAAHTKKAAVEMLQRCPRGTTFSRYHFDGWWSETGNTIELALATEVGVWGRVERFGEKYKRIL